MFIDLNLRLEDTVRRKRACERLDAKLRDIEERISRGRDILQALEVEEIEERDQIEKLRRLSISSLIYTLLFTAEGELTKGEIEYESKNSQSGRHESGSNDEKNSGYAG